MTKEDCYKSLLNTKVFVKDKSTSIQCILFSLGFEWNSGGAGRCLVTRTDAPFLFMSENGKITCSTNIHDFYSSNNEEVSAEYILSMRYIDEGISSLCLPSWINVEDDLPCNHAELLNAKYETKKVLILKPGGFPDIDYMLNVDGNWIWFTNKSPEFWMPIPKSPKE